MSKIVIAGAGLGGLFTAIRLLQRGVSSENILLIDPRAGHYTRPGHLRHGTFDFVSKMTEIETEHHSKSHHIKELERIMYGALKEKGVVFIEESFVTLQAQTETQAKR